MTANPSISFLPEDYLQRRTRRRISVLGVALLSVGLMAAGSAMFIAECSLDHIERLRADALRQYDQALAQQEETRKVEDARRCVLRRAQWAASLVEKAPRSNVLAELTNALPSGASLLTIDLQTHPRQPAPSVALTAFDAKKSAAETRQRAAADVETAPFDATLTVTGLAATDAKLATYLNQLGHCPLFRDPRLISSEIQEDRATRKSMRRFQVQMTVTSIGARR